MANYDVKGYIKDNNNYYFKDATARSSITTVDNKIGDLSTTQVTGNTVAAQITALNGKIPTTLASLTTDSTHRLVTDTQISTWNNKASNPGQLCTIDIYQSQTDPKFVSGETLHDGISWMINNAYKNRWKVIVQDALIGYNVSSFTKTFTIPQLIYYGEVLILFNAFDDEHGGPNEGDNYQSPAIIFPVISYDIIGAGANNKQLLPRLATVNSSGDPAEQGYYGWFDLKNSKINQRKLTINGKVFTSSPYNMHVSIYYRN